MEGFPRDEETGRYALQDVVTVDGASADELFSRASAWIATVYTSANDVIQLSDKPAGRLIAKGNLENSYMGYPAWVEHTLTIEVKDGRFRYVLTGFVFGNGHWSIDLEDDKKLAIGFKKPLARFRDQVLALEAHLRTAMLTPAPEW